MGGSHSAATTRLRVGTDIVDVSEVAASLATFGERYLRRIFTPAEVAYCTSGDRDPSTHLAARLAAKEATMKALRPEGDALPWRDIEVVRAPGGWCELRVTGEARALARRASIGSFALSMSHESRYATAVVIGEGKPASPRSGAPRRTRRNRRHTMPIEADIRAILKEHAKLNVDVTTLAEDADLHQAGMTSHASVNVMLALEGKFDVEFPDRMLRRGVFSSIGSIRAALEELTGGAQ
jgi:holo-[acyl-carrier protein] synthase